MLVKISLKVEFVFDEIHWDLERSEEKVIPISRLWSELASFSVHQKGPKCQDNETITQAKENKSYVTTT